MYPGAISHCAPRAAIKVKHSCRDRLYLQARLRNCLSSFTSMPQDQTISLLRFTIWSDFAKGKMPQLCLRFEHQAEQVRRLSWRERKAGLQQTCSMRSALGLG